MAAMETGVSPHWNIMIVKGGGERDHPSMCRICPCVQRFLPSTSEYPEAQRPGNRHT